MSQLVLDFNGPLVEGIQCRRFPKEKRVNRGSGSGDISANYRILISPIMGERKGMGTRLFSPLSSEGEPHIRGYTPNPEFRVTYGNNLYRGGSPQTADMCSRRRVQTQQNKLRLNSLVGSYQTAREVEWQGGDAGSRGFTAGPPMYSRGSARGGVSGGVTSHAPGTCAPHTTHTTYPKQHITPSPHTRKKQQRPLSVFNSLSYGSPLGKKNFINLEEEVKSKEPKSFEEMRGEKSGRGSSSMKMRYLKYLSSSFQSTIKQIPDLGSLGGGQIIPFIRGHPPREFIRKEQENLGKIKRNKAMRMEEKRERMRVRVGLGPYRNPPSILSAVEIINNLIKDANDIRTQYGTAFCFNHMQIENQNRAESIDYNYNFRRKSNTFVDKGMNEEEQIINAKKNIHKSKTSFLNSPPEEKNIDYKYPTLIKGKNQIYQKEIRQPRKKIIQEVDKINKSDYLREKFYDMDIDRPMLQNEDIMEIEFLRRKMLITDSFCKSTNLKPENRLLLFNQLIDQYDSSRNNREIKNRNSRQLFTKLYEYMQEKRDVLLKGEASLQELLTVHTTPAHTIVYPSSDKLEGGAKQNLAQIQVLDL